MSRRRTSLSFGHPPFVSSKLTARATPSFVTTRLWLWRRVSPALTTYCSASSARRTFTVFRRKFSRCGTHRGNKRSHRVSVHHGEDAPFGNPRHVER